MSKEEKLNTFIKICDNHSFAIFEFKTSGNRDIWTKISEEFWTQIIADGSKDNEGLVIEANVKFKTLLGDEIEIPSEKISYSWSYWKINGIPFDEVNKERWERGY